MSNTNSSMTILAAVVGCLLGGCAAMERDQVTDTEQILSAAGFTMKLADTPEKKAHLQTLTQLKLVPHNDGDQVRFIYADGKYCNCIFAGDQQDYQRFQQLALQKNLADEQRQAAMMNEDATMNWGMWGPYGW